MKILIDAGHGIDTPGKRSPDSSFLEYLWNREVADYLYAELHNYGLSDCELVVTETNDISLRNRVNRINAICNRVGKNNVILVSIHSNASGQGGSWGTAKGWSCYTTKGQTESDRIAEYLYDSFEKEFPERRMRKDMQDGDRDWEENFYIILKSACPAVLTENFFYDNREECQFLLREETKQRVAKATARGIYTYLKKNGKI